MGYEENSNSTLKRAVNFRICNVSGFKTELLEICSDDPKVYILFVPGNPGVVSFYKDFLESLYDLLGGTATVTAIGHISHTKKAEYMSPLNLEDSYISSLNLLNMTDQHPLTERRFCQVEDWEHCRLFSLQQQIDHKVDFIKQELQDIKVPIILVGHSIGAYISIETLRRSPEKVKYYIGLYPFLMLNPLSEKQATYKKHAKSSIKPALISFSVASLGLLPRCAKRLLVSKSIGKSWSSTAIDAASSHLLQYHTFRNMIFLALTEFDKLSEAPDWAFMRENQSKMTFLFGLDDHWGPMEMFDEIKKAGTWYSSNG